MLAQPRDLFTRRKTGRHRLIQLDAPYGLGTLFDEVVVSLAAGAQQLHGVAHLEKHDGQHEINHGQGCQVQLQSVDPHEGTGIAREGPVAAACKVGRHERGHGRERRTPAWRQAKCRDDHHGEQDERQIEDGRDAAGRRGKYPNRHGEQRAADEHQLGFGRRRRRQLAFVPPDGPAHHHRRNAKGSEPIPRPPKLPFAPIAGTAQHLRGAIGAHHGAGRRTERDGGEEPQYMSDPRNFRTRHESLGDECAYDAIERIRQDERRVPVPDKRAVSCAVDGDFHGDLYGEDPHPVAPRRKPQRHEQQAGRRPDEHQLLGTLAQSQAEQHQCRIQHAEGRQRAHAPPKSEAHEIPDKLGFTVSARRGRHRHGRTLPACRNSSPNAV